MSDNAMVTVKTNKGEFQVELWADRSPETAANFLSYVDDKFFDGTIFHRVIPGFMIQGGGFDPNMKQKSPKPPVKNEASHLASNDRGTPAMARTSDPHSATAQFFVNLVNNDFLNFKSATPQGWGYCVFGKVTQGMDVVDAIAKVGTASHGPHGDVPVEPVVIESVTRA